MSTDSVRLRSTGPPTSRPEADRSGISGDCGYPLSENVSVGDKLRRDNKPDPSANPVHPHLSGGDLMASNKSGSSHLAAERTSRQQKPRTRSKRTRRKLKAIMSNDFGVEIGGQSSFDILDRRIALGLIIVKRETLPDGRERITYRNVLP